MYCPRCGTSVCEDDTLFGGCCQWGCRTCKFAMNCFDFFTKKIDEDSTPIYNPIKAALLRIKYKK